MLNLIKRILGREYHFLNTIQISRSKLVQNYSYLRSLSPTLAIAPVLKSNAYGHGLVEIGKIVGSLKPPFICVDSLHEAYRLQKAGIKTSILIMGYINPHNLRFKRLPFSYAVYDLDYLQQIHRFQPDAPVHLKVDTGMHRMGIPVDSLSEVVQWIRQTGNVKVQGLMSHLATTNDHRNPQLKLQLRNFNAARNLLQKYQIRPKWLHLGASEAILNPKIRIQLTKLSNLIRAGKSFYGYPTAANDQGLSPALELITTIAQIKQLRRGEEVGYDGTFVAKKDSTIAVLPIGYFDGVDRRLSNKGRVLINGRICPIIGRVSMNITMVDVSKVHTISIGDTAVIISSNPTEPNSLVNIAKSCDTIPPEILIHLDSSIRRVIIN